MFNKIRGSIAVAVLSFAPQAYSLEIILNDVAVGGSSAEALKGFEAAASLWESLLTDDVTVRLDVGFEQLGDGILGSTGSEQLAFLYSDVRDAMFADVLSIADVTATNSLTDPGDFDFLIQDLLDPEAFIFVDQPGADAWNQTLAVNTANAKALGLIADDGSADGNVRFSSEFTFDFNPYDGIDADAFDFIGVAAHEIGHALGFVSSVDLLDFFSAPFGPGAGSFDTAFLAPFAVFTTLDLFRYSDLSANILPAVLGLENPLRDFTFGNLDDIYFSLDGGATNIAPFSTGSFNGFGTGGGRQASHWEDNLGLGLLDPTAGRGQGLSISELDLLAFDVIGWDVVKVPEPGTLSLFGLGLALIVIGRRGRRRIA